MKAHACRHRPAAGASAHMVSVAPYSTLSRSPHAPGTSYSLSSSDCRQLSIAFSGDGGLSGSGGGGRRRRGRWQAEPPGRSGGSGGEGDSADSADPSRSKADGGGGTAAKKFPPWYQVRSGEREEGSTKHPARFTLYSCFSSASVFLLQAWVWLTLAMYLVWRTKWRLDRARLQQEREDAATARRRGQQEWDE